jgi:hypothetical protein
VVDGGEMQEKMQDKEEMQKEEMQDKEMQDRDAGDAGQEMQGDAGQTKLPHVIKNRRESPATGVLGVISSVLDFLVLDFL